MAEARLEITLGSNTFLAEGSEGWVSEELERFLTELPKSAAFNPAASGNGHRGSTDVVPEDKASITLPTQLQQTASTANQIRKFLATAVWLQDRNNGLDVKTADVTKALRDSRQNSLTNAAECLNKNVGKGFCEKTASGFFVTSEGKASLIGLKVSTEVLL